MFVSFVASVISILLDWNVPTIEIFYQAETLQSQNWNKIYSLIYFSRGAHYVFKYYLPKMLFNYTPQLCNTPLVRQLVYHNLYEKYKYMNTAHNSAI